MIIFLIAEGGSVAGDDTDDSSFYPVVFFIRNKHARREFSSIDERYLLKNAKCINCSTFHT